MMNVKSSRLDRYYNIAKVLLCLTPFVCLAYLSMGGGQSGRLSLSRDRGRPEACGDVPGVYDQSVYRIPHDVYAEEITHGCCLCSCQSHPAHCS